MCRVRGLKGLQPVVELPRYPKLWADVFASQSVEVAREAQLLMELLMHLKLCAGVEAPSACELSLLRDLTRPRHAHVVRIQ